MRPAPNKSHRHRVSNFTCVITAYCCVTPLGQDSCRPVPNLFQTLLHTPLFCVDFALYLLAIIIITMSMPMCRSYESSQGIIKPEDCLGNPSSVLLKWFFFSLSFQGLVHFRVISGKSSSYIIHQFPALHRLNEWGGYANLPRM